MVDLFHPQRCAFYAALDVAVATLAAAALLAPARSVPAAAFSVATLNASDFTDSATPPDEIGEGTTATHLRKSANRRRVGEEDRTKPEVTSSHELC